MGARWYAPASGTFNSRDTIYGELATPVSLNRYTYALNNPLAYFDPDGHEFCYISGPTAGQCYEAADGEKAAMSHAREAQVVRALTLKPFTELPADVQAANPSGPPWYVTANPQDLLDLKAIIDTGASQPLLSGAGPAIPKSGSEVIDTKQTNVASGFTVGICGEAEVGFLASAQAQACLLVDGEGVGVMTFEAGGVGCCGALTLSGGVLVSNASNMMDLGGLTGCVEASAGVPSTTLIGGLGICEGFDANNLDAGNGTYTFEVSLGVGILPALVLAAVYEYYGKTQVVRLHGADAALAMARIVSTVDSADIGDLAVEGTKRAAAVIGEAIFGHTSGSISDYGDQEFAPAPFPDIRHTSAY